MRIVPAALLCVAPSGAVPAHAGFTFTFTRVLVEGDIISIGAVTSVDNLAVNNAGSWIVEVDTNNADTEADGALVKDDALHLREGQALAAPPGSSIDSFDAVNLSNTGNSGWNFFLNGTSGINDDSGIYRNAALVIQEGTFSTSPSFSPMTPYIGFFEARINDSDQILVVASIDDPAIATTVDRAMVRLEMSGNTLLSETVLAKEGDLLAGQTQTVADFSTGSHNSAFNNNGDALYIADLNGDTALDGAIYLNAGLLAQEGSASPVMGRNYELLLGRGLDLNNNGDYVFKANIAGDIADDEMIVKNGAVFVREGGTLPDIAGFTFTAFGLTSGPVQIDDNGNVLWFGDWNDPNLDKDTALFLNDQVVIGEGAIIDGQVLDEISNGDAAFQISDNGRWILFEGTFVGGISAAILVDVFDKPVPIVVSDFTAAAQGDRVQLGWTVSDSESELSWVEVERALDEAGPYEMLLGARLAPAQQMEYADASIEAGRPYWYRLALVNRDGSRSVTQPITIATAALVTALHSVAESGLDGDVRLRYSVARAGTPVRLAVHDVRGRLVWSREETAREARSFESHWNRRDATGTRVPRGVYVVQLNAGGVQQNRKLVLVRP